MPRKVDYASRFQVFREAAFAIVRSRGVGALSRRAIAEELGTSRNRIDDLLRAEADLRVLAAGEVKSRRAAGRFNLRQGEPPDAATRLVRSLSPTPRIASTRSSSGRGC
jgi:predicted transcriptional regulator